MQGRLQLVAAEIRVLISEYGNGNLSFFPMLGAFGHHSKGALLFGLGRRRGGCSRGEQAETIPEILALCCQSVVRVGWQDLLPAGSSVCLWSQHLPRTGMGFGRTAACSAPAHLPSRAAAAKCFSCLGANSHGTTLNALLLLHLLSAQNSCLKSPFPQQGELLKNLVINWGRA